MENTKLRATVNYNAIGTWLEPYINYSFPLDKVTKNFAYFTMHYGDGTSKHKESITYFDIKH